MIIRNKHATTLVLALTAASFSASSGVVLVDPGFEEALTATGSGVGKWEPFSAGGTNESITSTANPRTGAQSMRLILTDPNAFAGAFQDLPVIAGGEIIFSGWNTISVGDSGGTEIRIEFRDSVGGVEITRTANFVPTVTGDYSEFSLSATVPAGADTARLVYAIQSFGAPAPQTVDVDDFSVSGSALIPEPTGGALMLLGFAGLAMRRRR